MNAKPRREPVDAIVSNSGSNGFIDFTVLTAAPFADFLLVGRYSGLLVERLHAYWVLLAHGTVILTGAFGMRGKPGLRILSQQRRAYACSSSIPQPLDYGPSGIHVVPAINDDGSRCTAVHLNATAAALRSGERVVVPQRRTVVGARSPRDRFDQPAGQRHRRPRVTDINARRPSPLASD